jgi:hypothetical protein
MCRQNDSPGVERIFGKYQAGFIGFRNDAEARECLTWWRDRCFEWCSSEQGLPDRWGDQKYLDKWPELFNGVRITNNWGIDAAVWSAKGNLSVRDSKAYIKNSELIAYHFCCFVIYNENEYDLWMWNNWCVDDDLIRYIYLPYIEALRQSMKDLSATGLNICDLFNYSVNKNTTLNYYVYNF